mgnify:CR=1 FL=1
MTFDLVTFGDSWTKGCGVGYVDGMSKEEYKKIFNNKEICDKYAYRTVLAEKWGCKNINFACMASSNMRQFRHAMEYFKSKPKRRTIVLWATTTLFRHEVWMNKRKKKGDKGYVNLVYLHEYNLHSLDNKVRDKTDGFNHILEHAKVNIHDHIINHVDKDNLLKILCDQMDHWNLFFDSLGIENYWIDTHHHHNYTNANSRILFNDKPRRDLLSMLLQDNEARLTPEGDEYERRKKAVELGLVIPYSGHPTKESHIKIADMIDEEINLINNIR